MSKCRLGLTQVQYIGHIVSKYGIKMSQERKKAVEDTKMPQTLTQLRSFLGVCNYFRKFIPDYAEKAKPLYELEKGMKSKKEEIKWSDFSREKYSILKKAVVDAEMLFFIRPEGDITLNTDASDDAVGGHLTQIQDGQEKTIMFVSKFFFFSSKKMVNN